MKLTETQLKQVLEMERGELKVLSPFIFKKISLSHLEIDEEINLKFLCSNELKKQELKEKYGVDTITESFEKLKVDFLIDIVFEYLSGASRRELKNIMFTTVDDEGEVKEVQLSVKKKFKSLFVSSMSSIMELFDVFLTIHGFTKDQLKALNSSSTGEKKNPLLKEGSLPNS